MFGLWEDDALAIEPKAPPVAETFGRWVAERCHFVDRYWTPVSVLHGDFCTWNVSRDCDQPMFAALLDEAGLCLETTRSGVAWCYGLVLAVYLPPEWRERTRACPLDEQGRLVLKSREEEEA